MSFSEFYKIYPLRMQQWKHRKWVIIQFYKTLFSNFDNPSCLLYFELTENSSRNICSTFASSSLSWNIDDSKNFLTFCVVIAFSRLLKSIIKFCLVSIEELEILRVFQHPSDASYRMTVGLLNSSCSIWLLIVSLHSAPMTTSVSSLSKWRNHGDVVSLMEIFKAILASTGWTWK